MLYKSGWFSRPSTEILGLPNEIRILQITGKDKIWVHTHEIPGIIEKNMEYIRFFIDYKNLGNPFNGGWYSWPCWAYDIINALNGIDWNK